MAAASSMPKATPRRPARPAVLQSDTNPAQASIGGGAAQHAKPAANRRLLRHARLSLKGLADNAAHQFAAEHALAIYVADAVYSFIPKNACSTLRYSIALANGAIAGAADFNWIHANNLTFRASLAELAKARYTFATLRDPYLRLGSCYLDKIVDQTDIAWRYHILSGYRIAPAALSFRQFVAGLRSQVQADQHWRPQLDFLVYEHYDDFFCLENFTEAVATLHRKIGLEVRDARGLTRHGTDRYAPLQGDQPFADTPACEIAALKRGGHIPRITQLYDAPLIADVERLYRKDIRFYMQTTGRPVAFS